MSAAPTVAPLPRALPFWAPFGLLPLVAVAAIQGGWTLFLLPVATWWLFSVLDAVLGQDEANADISTEDAAIRWHRRVTLAWPPVQIATLLALLAYATRTDHLSVGEELGLFFGMGILSGTVGIVYAHELMHQKNRGERWLADVLLASVLYSHFRSEHLLVHHRHVGTPRDTVTARFGEGFHAFFFRVVSQSLPSAFRAEAALLARKDRPWWDRRNPFWRYWALQAAFLLAAVAIGGWWGLALFVFQSVVAFWQLELVNYVEHYGLVRRHVGDGRYEPVRPHHSWNAAQMASNRLLINLQRHPDHHARPDRRFPLLQNHGPDEAPQLPYGYPVMTALALVPPLWRRVMDRRVLRWRRRFYPDVSDWSAYDTM